MTTSISVKRLSKKYLLGVEPYLTFKDTLSSLSRLPSQLAGNWITPGERLAKGEFWALKDISFEVRPGEIVGIIGRNGAGKSTLLKVISRITSPTVGEVRLRGKVSSLLEIGTGFNPEFTGRENIYLNGSILGMSRQEIRGKLQEIVDFADIGRFINSPVKHYSSGMYMRLAFSIAIHVHPEILLLDEVLAVGDLQFQKKALERIKNTIRGGRTVLLVSHGMSAVTNLCHRAIFLDQGRLVAYDRPDKVISLYYNTVFQKPVTGVKVKSYLFGGTREWDPGTKIAVEVSWRKNQFPIGWECDLAVYTIEGVKVFAVQSQALKDFSSTNPRANKITFFITNPGFLDRNLRVDVGIRTDKDKVYDLVLENCLRLHPSGKQLPSYRIPETIIVPEINCEVGQT